MDEGAIKLYGLVERYKLELEKIYGITRWLDVDLGGSTICGIHEIVLISKKFGFIQWLIENDKINFDKNEYKQSIEELNGECRPFEEYELLLMVLSIQDNPISFLISILKEDVYQENR